MSENALQRCNICGRLANAPHTVWAYGIIVEQCSDPCHRQYVQGCILDYSAIGPTTVYPFEGHMWMEVDCPDYEAWCKLPPAIEYDGLVYGRTGWNSDYGKGYYSTRQKVGYRA